MSHFFREIRWGRALAAFAAAEAGTIAAAFGWVAVYSHLLNPGRDLAHYQAYAMTTRLRGIACRAAYFYLACRWIRANGVAVFALYCLLQIPFLLLSDTSSIPSWILFAGFPSKFLGCWLGGGAAK